MKDISIITTVAFELMKELLGLSFFIFGMELMIKNMRVNCLAGHILIPSRNKGSFIIFSSTLRGGLSVSVVY